MYIFFDLLKNYTGHLVFIIAVFFEKTQGMSEKSSEAPVSLTKGEVAKQLRKLRSGSDRILDSQTNASSLWIQGNEDGIALPRWSLLLGEEFYTPKREAEISIRNKYKFATSSWELGKMDDLSPGERAELDAMVDAAIKREYRERRKSHLY
jgi:hypothetical protein